MKVFEILLDIVYPRECLLCAGRIAEQQYRGVCAACLDAAVWPVAPSLKQTGLAFDWVWSLGPYQGPLKKLIHAFKFQHDRGLGRDLARAMAVREGFSELLRQADGLIPVPMHAAKERMRGYNQARVLAEELSALTGVPSTNGVLEKNRPSVPQTELGQAERWRNVEGTFAFVRRPPGEARHWVLVDDVMTTGATAHHCACLLREAGAASVGVLVIARN